jgi:hypothetical protein
MTGIRVFHKNSRMLIAGVMLLAFAVRALIPQGFMPSSDRRFAVEICPEGLPSQLVTHTHGHHGGGHSSTDHCVFGTACASGPLSHPSVLTDISFSAIAPAAPSTTETIAVRLVFLPHSRGPPLVS